MKEFFGVLISVLVCVFVAFLFVYAATTISEDIDVDTGKLVAGHDAIMEHALQVGYTATKSYSRFSTADTATGHGLTANDDVLFAGLVEFDDDVYFDDFASIADDVYLRVPLIYGAVDSGRYLRIGDQAFTSHSLNAQDDLLVTGKLEVDGTAFFDGTVSVSDANGLEIGGGATLFGGTASPQSSVISCSIGDWYFRSGAAVSASFYFCDVTDEWAEVF